MHCCSRRQSAIITDWLHLVLHWRRLPRQTEPHIPAQKTGQWHSETNGPSLENIYYIFHIQLTFAPVKAENWQYFTAQSVNRKFGMFHQAVMATSSKVSICGWKLYVHQYSWLLRKIINTSIQLCSCKSARNSSITRWEYPNVTWRISSYLFTYLRLPVPLGIKWIIPKLT